MIRTVSTPFNQSDDERIRLSDEERNQAMDALGVALGEGRLSITEFDERCSQISQAQYRRVLNEVFHDIPRNIEAPSTAVEQYFSSSQIESARESSKNPKLGTALLISFGGMIASPFFILAGAGATGAAGTMLGVGAGMVGFFLVPAIWIALYVMKIGPESWHTPSPRQIEKQRLRELKSAEAVRRAEQKALNQQKWSDRRQQAGELTDDAMHMVRDQLDKWKKR